MITAMEETKMIVIHGDGVNISHYALQDKYKQRIKITKFLVYPKNQQVNLNFCNQTKRAGRYLN